MKDSFAAQSLLPVWTFDSLLTSDEVSAVVDEMEGAHWSECKHAITETGEHIGEELVACTALPMNDRVGGVVRKMAGVWGGMVDVDNMKTVPAIRYKPGAPGVKAHYDAFYEGDTVGPDATLVA